MSNQTQIEKEKEQATVQKVEEETTETQGEKAQIAPKEATKEEWSYCDPDWGNQYIP